MRIDNTTTPYFIRPVIGTQLYNQNRQFKQNSHQKQAKAPSKFGKILAATASRDYGAGPKFDVFA